MYNQFMQPIDRVWKIQAHSPKEDGRYQYLTINVKAKTVEEAMGKVREKYPTCKFLNITHQGEIDIL